EVAHQASGMNDGDGDTALFRRWKAGFDLCQRFAQELDAAGGEQADDEAVGSVANVGAGAVRPGHVARAVVVAGARTSTRVPEAKSPVLLIALHFSVGADDLVALVDGAFKVGRRDPVVLVGDAHTVVPIDTYLNSVVGVDTVSQQSALLADG